jgi:hypothetical protein
MRYFLNPEMLLCFVWKARHIYIFHPARFLRRVTSTNTVQQLRPLAMAIKNLSAIKYSTKPNAMPSNVSDSLVTKSGGGGTCLRTSNFESFFWILTGNPFWIMYCTQAGTAQSVNGYYKLATGVWCQHLYRHTQKYLVVSPPRRLLSEGHKPRPRNGLHIRVITHHYRYWSKQNVKHNSHVSSSPSKSCAWELLVVNVVYN